MTETCSIAATCMDWWKACIAAETETARRARAQLRRAASVTDVLGVGAAHELHRRLLAAGHDLRRRRDGPDRLALIAVALAQVREDLRATAARRFGSGDPKALSALKFNALIRAHEPRQLMRPLVRALRVTRGSANVRRLAFDLYWWSDTTRNSWCFEYYGAADAGPTPEDSEA